MKKLSLIINLGCLLGVASPLIALDKPTQPTYVPMSDEEVYHDPLSFFYDTWGMDELSNKLRVVEVMARLGALKSMRSVIEKSEMEPKTKESVLKIADKKIMLLEQLLNEKKQDLATKRTYRKVMFGLTLAAPILLMSAIGLGVMAIALGR